MWPAEREGFCYMCGNFIRIGDFIEPTGPREGWDPWIHSGCPPEGSDPYPDEDEDI